MIKISNIALIAGIAGLATGSASAAFAYTGVSSPDVVAGDSGFFVDDVFGYDFTVGADPIEVIALGYFSQSGGFLEAAAELGIYQDTDGLGGADPVLLTTTSVSLSRASDDRDGVHNYYNLTVPVVLNANETYRLVATTGNNGGNHNTVPGSPSGGVLPDVATISSALTIDTSGDFNSNAGVGGSLVYPALELGPSGFDSPLTNLQFNVVPEPSGILLLALGSIGSIGRRRR